MPLKKGTKPGSPGFGENIATEIKAGKPPKQAEAIAYAKTRGDVDAKLDALKARCDALEPSPHGRISAAQQKHELGLDARIDALCARADAKTPFERREDRLKKNEEMRKINEKKNAENMLKERPALITQVMRPK